MTGSVTLLLLMVIEGSPPATMVAHELNSVAIATMLINTYTFLLFLTCFVCILVVFDFILDILMRTVTVEQEQKMGRKWVSPLTHLP